MRCSICAKETVVTIRMRIGGEDVTFRRCSSCERNEWLDNGGARSLGDILELARITR